MVLIIFLRCQANVIHLVRFQRPTTRPRATTRAPPPSTSSECFNEHPCCDRWAWMGRCEEDFTYMQTNCPASCRLCQTSFDPTIGTVIQKCLEAVYQPFNTNCYGGIWRGIISRETGKCSITAPRNLRFQLLNEY